MQTYEFVAISSSGERVHGTERAADEFALDHELESRGMVLTTSKVVNAKLTVAQCGMTTAELGLFTTQLATVISAGLSLIEGLEGIEKRLTSPRAQNLIKHMVAEIRAGESLSEAMKPFPKTFPVAYQASVRAGEAAGSLDTVLIRLAAFLDWSRSMRATTMQALIYPAILMVAIFGLILLLLFYVMPQLLSLFPKGKASLPWQTEVVLGVSDFIRDNAPLIGIGAVLVGGFLTVTWKRPAVRLGISKAALHIPKLGTIAKQLAMSRFASTASTLQAAGCSVFMVLDVAAETCGNAALTEAFKRSIERVRRGGSISDALSEEPLVDPLLVQMVGVGERAGALEHTLDKLSGYYDEEVPRAVKKFLALLEPLLLLGAGGIVAFILMAAMLPLFELYENIG
jgi:general secretion pathway protein F